MSDIAVIVMAVLALFFPGRLITAIREQDEEKAQRAKIHAGLLFGAMVFLMGLFLNSVIA